MEHRSTQFLLKVIAECGKLGSQHRTETAIRPRELDLV